MKKILLTILAVTPFMFGACSDSDDGGKDVNGDGNGSVKFTSRVNSTINERVLSTTRATDITDLTKFFLIFDGPVTRTVQYPSNDIVEDLRVGSYKVTFASHESMPDAAFDTQYYSGETNVTIAENTESIATISAKQANTGIFFVYDDAFAAQGMTVVPTVASSNGSLTYSGANSDAVGYFAPGATTLTLKTADGKTLNLDGETSKTWTTNAQEVWEVTLKYETSMNSGTVKVTYKVTDAVTDELLSFNVGEPEPVPPFSPETIDDYVKSYAVTAAYPLNQSVLVTPGALSWNETLEKINNDGFVYLEGSNFANRSFPCYFDWYNNEPDVIVLDLYTPLAIDEQENNYIIPSLALFYNNNANVAFFPDEEIDFEWDAQLNAAVFEIGQGNYELENGSIVTGVPSIILAGYNANTGKYSGSVYSDAYARIQMTMQTSSGSGAVRPNSVERSGNEIIATAQYVNENIKNVEYIKSNLGKANTKKKDRYSRF